MKTLGKIMIALALLLFLAAIWISAYWPQLLATGLLALFVGAGILGQKPKAGIK